jgi:hypothetical protein
MDARMDVIVFYALEWRRYSGAMRLPDDRILVAWLDHRRREKWLLGGVIVIGGVVAIVSAMMIAASGAIDADSVLLQAVMLGILLVAFVPAAQLNRLWQRRRYQLDENTLQALDLAF